MKFTISALVFGFVVGWLATPAIERAAAQTRLAPEQLSAPKVTVLACSGATSATSDCTGLYYVDVVTPSGQELKIIGAPATAPLDPARWNVVP